jgi:hypothetical protein
MDVFYIEGISTPVTALQIEGKNAPSPEGIQKFSEFYMKENFSTARLTRVIQRVIRDLYKPRGYLRPAIAEPEIQSLGRRTARSPFELFSTYHQEIGTYSAPCNSWDLPSRTHRCSCPNGN